MDNINDTQTALKELVHISNKYGADARYVLAGGGNSSWKSKDALYVKASGMSMATIKTDGFVGMDRARLAKMMERQYDRSDDAAREAAVLSDMYDSRLPGFESLRPSVETLLHDLFPFAFVLHLHPALVNGMTCGAQGEKAARELFGDDAVWVPEFKPGYELAKLCAKFIGDYVKMRGAYPKILFHQNHGVFVAADGISELDELYDAIMSKIGGRIAKKPVDELKTGMTSHGYAHVKNDLSAGCASVENTAAVSGNTPAEGAAVSGNTPAEGAAVSGNTPVEGLASGDADEAEKADETDIAATRVKEWLMSLSAPPAGILFMNGPDILSMLESREAFSPLDGAFTPDHIVYCKTSFLYLDCENYYDSVIKLPAAYDEYVAKNKHKPRLICVRGLGAFAAADSPSETVNAAALFADAVNVAIYSANFGGPRHLSAELVDFIVNWEIESYRAKIAR